MTLREVMAITTALSDENRVRAICALRGGELCVCQLIELLNLAPSTVSKHLSILKQARLVDSRKDGRWMHYRLPGKDAPQNAQEAIQWILASLLSEGIIAEDKKRLKAILKEDPEELCRRQMGRTCCPPKQNTARQMARA